MKNNCQFEVAEPIDQYFQLYFELVENEKEGEYLTAAEIFDYLKKADRFIAQGEQFDGIRQKNWRI